jgi:hypothetical protein
MGTDGEDRRTKAGTVGTAWEAKDRAGFNHVHQEFTSAPLSIGAHKSRHSLPGRASASSGPVMLPSTTLLRISEDRCFARQR